MSSQKSQINNLMIVDDDKTDQFLYKRIIDRSGMVRNLITCFYAEEALEQLRNKPFPDAILLDINMPRMNGFEFLEAATEEFGSDFSAVVVMLTTSLNPSDQAKANTFSAVKEYFNKPLTAEHMQQILELTYSQE